MQLTLELFPQTVPIKRIRVNTPSCRIYKGSRITFNTATENSFAFHNKQYVELYINKDKTKLFIRFVEGKTKESRKISYHSGYPSIELPSALVHDLKIKETSLGLPVQEHEGMMMIDISQYV